MNKPDKYQYMDEGFNRYMVECESRTANNGLSMIALVLIDTWWNVNLKCYTFRAGSRQVLIDTWWNVNTFSSGSSAGALLF